MKKRYYLSIFALVFLLTACDLITTPYVLGVGTVTHNEEDYCCVINGNELLVDSLLLDNVEERIFVPPRDGMEVTCFELCGKKYFFEGNANPQKIKNIFFINDPNKGNLSLPTFIAVLAIIYFSEALDSNPE